MIMTRCSLILSALLNGILMVSAFLSTSSQHYYGTTSYAQLCASNSPLGDASGTIRGKANYLTSQPKGIIFDMDGTLIQHSIDFAEMRRRIYQVADADPVGKDLERTCVLSLAKQLSSEGQMKANDIFADIERRALNDMKLMPGGAELLSFLIENDLRRAVLTRNLEKNVYHMQQLYCDEMEHQDDSLFFPIVARDTVADPFSDEPLRAKPHPDGILHVCSLWECNPAEVIMVGDSANDDMTAANRAGCGGAVLLTQPNGGSLDTDSGYKVGDSEEEIMERTPSTTVDSLYQLKMYLQELLDNQNRRLVLAESNGLNETEDGNFVYSSARGYTIDIPSIGVKRT
eukprot:scaffold300983_cov79-Cyclotella_meneghiniana.AAC.1